MSVSGRASCIGNEGHGGPVKSDDGFDPGLVSALGTGFREHIRHEIGRERVGTTKPFLQHTKLLLVFRTKQHYTVSSGHVPNVRDLKNDGP
jgi:hypothetical protein